MNRLVAMRCQMEGTDKNANEPIHNPLTKTGKKVMESMVKTYGSKKKAKRVFYGSINSKKKGTKRWH